MTKYKWRIDWFSLNGRTISQYQQDYLAENKKRVVFAKFDSGKVIGFDSWQDSFDGSEYWIVDDTVKLNDSVRDFETLVIIT